MTAVKIKTDVKEGLMQIIRPYLPVETQDMEVNGDSHFINDLKVNFCAHGRYRTGYRRLV